MTIRRFPSLPSWPLASAELDNMRLGLERLFDSLSEGASAPGAGVFPAVNLSADDESVYVRAELPGIDPDKLDLTIENDTLTIAGERTMPSDSGDVSYHRRERGWGKFRRSLPVPVHVDPADIQARYRDGLLTIVLGKAPQARPKQIAVQAEA